MYHMTHLLVKNTDVESMTWLLNRILVNPYSAARSIRNLQYDFDEETGEYAGYYDNDLYECLEPSKMGLPKGAHVEVYYTQE